MTASSSTSDPRQRTALGSIARRLIARGRGAGLVALALALGLLLIEGDRGLAGLRRFGFDQVERQWPRRFEGRIVPVVAIDDESLRRFGQWPWPRNLVAELIRRIHAHHPLVLGIDLMWPEADRLSPQRWAAQERDLPADLVERLAALPDHDTSLADAIAAGPTVLGVVGLRDGQGTTGPLAPVRSRGGDPAPALPAHSALLRSLPALDRAAAGHGLLSVDKDSDGQVRRMPTFGVVGAAGAGVPVPALTLDMLRLALGAPQFDLFVEDGGVVGVQIGDFALPTQRDGSIWLALTPSDRRRFISAADILDGTVGGEKLEDSLVLLGVTGLAQVDRVATPLDQMLGVELHAQLLEMITDDKFAARPRWAPAAEAGLLLVAGLALIALLPRRRLVWYVPAALLVPAALGGVSVASWLARFWLIDAALPALGSTAVLVALLGGGLAEADKQRRRLRRELDAQRLSAARLAGELEAARRIQMGILPRPEALAPDARFDLDAVLEPAKEVGGDLYDFFVIEGRHLFIAVGDVTGKGVPASLFMALGKSLYKSCVLRGHLDPAAITETANREIARDNPEMLFITLFAGLLDLDTGRLVYCNAGHEQPFAVLPGAPPRQLGGSGGPPLCVLDEFPYTADSDQLRPGEILCLVTDGVTEAMNPAAELLGHAPVATCLAALPPGADAAAALAALRATVAAFVGTADPSDDLTALTVRWTGPGPT